jgi:hypothetical protein
MPLPNAQPIIEPNAVCAAGGTNPGDVFPGAYLADASKRRLYYVTGLKRVTRGGRKVMTAVLEDVSTGMLFMFDRPQIEALRMVRHAPGPKSL